MKIRQTASYYSPEQVAQYFKHVQKATGAEEQAIELSEQDVQNGLFPCTLENLGLLMRLHLLTFPFEDTAMHFTPEHTMDISREGVFKRLVLAGKGYGSYCFGHNTLLLGILRGLGYCAISVPGRVNNVLSRPSPSQTELTIQSHMVLLVQSDAFPPPADTPNGTEPTYVVDVGFGGYVPTRPIPLIPNVVVPGSAPPEEFRLVRGYHPKSSLQLDNNDNDDETSPASLLHPQDWKLQIRNGSDISEWRDAYQFQVTETFPEDHEAWNCALHRQVEGPGAAPFWGTVIAVKHFVVAAEDVGGQEVDKEYGVRLGKVYVVANSVSKRVGDMREKVAVLKDELDRVRALREYVGINIAEEDTVYIKGRASAL